MTFLNDLTPVQLFDQVYYKREDLLRPFGEYNVNGSKIRQAYAIFKAHEDIIKTKFNGHVALSSAVVGTTAPTICKVAQEFGIQPHIMIGGTSPEASLKHDMMRLIVKNKGIIKIVCKMPLTTVINKRTSDVIQEENLFDIRFDVLYADDPESIFLPIEAQVANIPDDLDNLVIPVGKGSQIIGILSGLKKYNKKVKKIYCVGVGPNVENMVRDYATFLNWDYPEYSDLLQNSNIETINVEYDYKVMINRFANIDRTISLDPIYEAKVHEWMYNNINIKNEKTLFWIIANRPSTHDVDMLSDVVDTNRVIMKYKN